MNSCTASSSFLPFIFQTSLTYQIHYDLFEQNKLLQKGTSVSSPSHRCSLKSLSSEGRESLGTGWYVGKRKLLKKRGGEISSVNREAAMSCQ